MRAEDILALAGAAATAAAAGSLSLDRRYGADVEGVRQRWAEWSLSESGNGNNGGGGGGSSRSSRPAFLQLPPLPQLVVLRNSDAKERQPQGRCCDCCYLSLRKNDAGRPAGAAVSWDILDEEPSEDVGGEEAQAEDFLTVAECASLVFNCAEFREVAKTLMRDPDVHVFPGTLRWKLFYGEQSLAAAELRVATRTIDVLPPAKIAHTALGAEWRALSDEIRKCIKHFRGSEKLSPHEVYESVKQFCTPKEMWRRLGVLFPDPNEVFVHRDPVCNRWLLDGGAPQFGRRAAFKQENVFWLGADLSTGAPELRVRFQMGNLSTGIIESMEVLVLFAYHLLSPLLNNGGSQYTLQMLKELPLAVETINVAPFHLSRTHSIFRFLLAIGDEKIAYVQITPDPWGNKFAVSVTPTLASDPRQVDRAVIEDAVRKIERSLGQLRPFRVAAADACTAALAACRNIGIGKRKLQDVILYCSLRSQANRMAVVAQAACKSFRELLGDWYLSDSRPPGFLTVHMPHHASESAISARNRSMGIFPVEIDTATGQVVYRFMGLAKYRARGEAIAAKLTEVVSNAFAGGDLAGFPPTIGGMSAATYLEVCGLVGSRAFAKTVLRLTGCHICLEDRNLIFVQGPRRQRCVLQLVRLDGRFQALLTAAPDWSFRQLAEDVCSCINKVVNECFENASSDVAVRTWQNMQNLFQAAVGEERAQEAANNPKLYRWMLLDTLYGQQQHVAKSAAAGASGPGLS